MTRDELAEEVDAITPALSASRKAQILLAADEYAAALIDVHARSPRSQMDSQRRAS